MWWELTWTSATCHCIPGWLTHALFAMILSAQGVCVSSQVPSWQPVLCVSLACTCIFQLSTMDAVACCILSAQPCCRHMAQHNKLALDILRTVALWATVPHVSWQVLVNDQRRHQPMKVFEPGLSSAHHASRQAANKIDPTHSLRTFVNTLLLYRLKAFICEAHRNGASPEAMESFVSECSRKLCLELSVTQDPDNSRYFPSMDKIRRVCHKEMQRMRFSEVSSVCSKFHEVSACLQTAGLCPSPICSRTQCSCPCWVCQHSNVSAPIAGGLV